MKKKTPSIAHKIAALNEEIMPETLDEDGGAGMGGGGEAPGGAMGGAVAGAPGSCPGCEGQGEVHAGDCQHAEQNNLPREGFGYVIAPEHKKHKHHHVADEQSNPSIPDINDQGMGQAQEMVGSPEQEAGELAEKAKLGSGARFHDVEKAAKASGADNPAAVAAAAGIKKYGVKGMEKLAHHNEENEIRSVDMAKDHEHNAQKKDDGFEDVSQPLEEGKYLQSGLSTREAPIPFTQDPSNEGVPDYLNDEEKASVGLKSQTGMPAESGSSMEESMSTTSIMDQFKKGDIVNIDRVRNVEWIVESVQIDPDQITVKSGKRKKTLSPKVSFIEHVDGAEVHKERQFESIENLREEYLKMTIEEDKRGLKADWCTYEESAKPEAVEDKRPILEKNELYKMMKDRGYEHLSEGKVLQSLCEEIGNPLAEIQRILEDVGLSAANETIDTGYRYNTSAFEENEYGLTNTLENAWKDIEAKELEETAKKNDEQPGANCGGLGPKQHHVKFNL